MTAAEWLEGRLSGVPAELAEPMLSALEPAAGGSIADQLGDAAVRLYAQVLAGDGSRRDALPLLAADALLTHAFEAQAELAPQALADFADRWATGDRLAALLPAQ